MSGPTPQFTLGELLAFLREDQAAEGYYTAREWAERLGVSEYRMSKLLQAANRAGILHISRAPRVNLAGIEHHEVVYAFEFEGEKVGEDSKGAV